MNTSMTLILREGDAYFETKNLDTVTIEFDPLSPIVDVLEEKDSDYRMRRKITMPKESDDIEQYGLIIPDEVNKHILFKNMWSEEDIFMAASRELLDETVKTNVNSASNGFLFRRHIRIAKTMFIDIVFYCESSNVLFNIQSKIFDSDFGKIIKDYISIKNKKIEWIDLNLIYRDMINIINSEAVYGKMNYGYDSVFYLNPAIQKMYKTVFNRMKLPRKFYTIPSKYKKNGLKGIYIHHEGGLLRKIFR